MIKYLNQLFKYIKLFYECKIIFQNPTKKDFLVFDNESYDQIKNLISRYDQEILVTRKENLNKIYFSFRILLLTIIHYKGNLFSSYITSLIILSKPKIVFTFIDNSFKFSEIAKSFKKINKKIKFIALQNGARYEPLEYEYLYNKGFSKKNDNTNFYLPKLLSFGLYEKELYKKKNINAKSILPVGNIRLESYINYKKNKKPFKKKKQICLLSEHNNWNKNVALNSKDFTKNYFKLFNFTLRYALDKKIKIIVCSKRIGLNKKNDFTSPFYEENKAFDDFIDSKYKKFFKKNLTKRSRDKFQTYKNMDQSEIVIGTMSTLLRENLVLKNKVFACNTSNQKIYNFPLREFFFADINTYSHFEKKLNSLLKMPQKKYFSKISKKIDYLMENKKSTTAKIQKILDSELKNS